MTSDRLSKREDRALHQALASTVLTQFQNPQRKDCPETSVLRAIAKKNIAMRDPAHEHVGRCSPCFSELTEIREVLHRRKMMWAMVTTGTAVLVLVFIGFYVGYVGNPLRQETVQPHSPSRAPQIDQSNGGRPPSQPAQVAATLDLRNASATRTVQPSGSTSNPIGVPRGMLALRVELPIGSEPGTYAVEIRKANLPAMSAAKAQARIENGVTTLLINIDTSSIPAGEYEFAWRLADYNWRHYPILLP